MTLLALLDPADRVAGYAAVPAYDGPGRPLAAPGYRWVEVATLPALGSQMAVCGCCETVHGAAEWLALARCGVTDDGELELRHCPCGSTLSIEL